LNPGVVEVIETAEITKKFFGKWNNTRRAWHCRKDLPLFTLVSGGFATINPDNSLNINAVEACPLNEISLEVIELDRLEYGWDN
jgi:F-type H+-transporting ATPase subunit delta